MPLFFFDISDGTLEPDLHGSELAGIDQARIEAIKFVGELLQHHSHMIWDGHDLRVDVSDGDRIPVFAVTVSVLTMFPTS